MGNFVIDQRIERLEKVKANLLTLKKSKRGDELKQVNSMIGRLKRWNNELAQMPKKQQTTPTGKYFKDLELIGEIEYKECEHLQGKNAKLFIGKKMSKSEFEKLSMGDFQHSNNEKRCNNCNCKEENTKKECKTRHKEKRTRKDGDSPK